MHTFYSTALLVELSKCREEKHDSRIILTVGVTRAAFWLCSKVYCVGDAPFSRAVSHVSNAAVPADSPQPRPPSLSMSFEISRIRRASKENSD
ncbi:uncharacterized protein [Penaeus vannamei]|uniref:uncharacterized protein isoform X2 n=1 Tax=Penaeus vannamei TaxID=6689 RepID=UPI00387F97A4